jgi:hypothetical protein
MGELVMGAQPAVNPPERRIPRAAILKGRCAYQPAVWPPTLHYCCMLLMHAACMHAAVVAAAVTTAVAAGPAACRALAACNNPAACQRGSSIVASSVASLPPLPVVLLLHATTPACAQRQLHCGLFSSKLACVTVVVSTVVSTVHAFVVVRCFDDVHMCSVLGWVSSKVLVDCLRSDEHHCACFRSRPLLFR